MSEEAGAEQEPFADYTAFQTWDYKPFVYVLEHKKPWISYKESFYRASELIIDDLAHGRGFPEIEGIAAVFLFRHYLELVLKRIIVEGRRLIRADQNAAWEDVKEAAKIHRLDDLWKLVLVDAKPKIEARIWDSYDIPFVEKCIAEFHERDEKGFAFRYPQQGGEQYEYDFQYFRSAMEHVYQVLENMLTVLIEQHAQNQEWIDIQNSF
jgi:hypothetical protein